jgi:hypothetical protein
MEEIHPAARSSLDGEGDGSDGLIAEGARPSSRGALQFGLHALHDQVSSAPSRISST